MPPGWLPVNVLDDKPTWDEFRKGSDKVHLYVPAGVENVRGIFVCYVFHSGDPRELARLWQFALVTVPTPFEYDLGFFDKRNARGKEGRPVGNMGVLLSYLDEAAKELKRPELSKAPIVGWAGQNGSVMANDLYKRAPERLLCWTDSWYPAWLKYPELIAKVPVASAWEFNPKDREAERAKVGPTVEGKATPPDSLRCYASTYGFGHGIYSKWNFFMAYTDRVIQLRLPEKAPPAGQPVKLRDVDITKGWAGDYNEVSNFNKIVPYGEAKGFVAPTWMPDRYAAHMWRAYHSEKPDIKLVKPIVEYRKGVGPEGGLGYGGQVKADTALTFTAETTGQYVKLEFYSGDQLLGETKSAPWTVEGIKLKRGLHALHVVGTAADGKQSTSRACFLVVE